MPANRQILKARSEMLRAVRHFFDVRGVLEVDCPILTRAGSLDAHIDLIPALYGGSERYYLFTSPEYGMKQLLASGSGDIYQLSHVFRDGELGQIHRPEFTMIEWYRIAWDLERLIAETAALCELFVGATGYEVISYRDVFLQYTGLDPFETSTEELLTLTEPFDGWELEGRDALLHLILASHIEPKLGTKRLTVVTDYPASQAALARSDGVTAQRFEIYYKGIELANGYHELADTIEQRARFEEANTLRQLMGKAEMPLDEEFLAALDKLPDCCGVAVGFDRLLMLKLGKSHLKDVLPLDPY